MKNKRAYTMLKWVFLDRHLARTGKIQVPDLAKAFSIHPSVANRDIQAYAEWMNECIPGCIVRMKGNPATWQRTPSWEPLPLSPEVDGIIKAIKFISRENSRIENGKIIDALV